MAFLPHRRGLGLPWLYAGGSVSAPVRSPPRWEASRETRVIHPTTSGQSTVLVRGARVVLGNTTRSSLAEERLQRSQGPAWTRG